MPKNWTTIKISRAFKHLLDKKGKKNESYETILKKLINKNLLKLPKNKFMKI